MIRNSIFLLVFAVLFATGCSKDSLLEHDIAIIEQYLKTHNLSAQSLSSGLYYIIEDPGSGSGYPAPGSVVKVRYTGFLPDGQIFDQTIGNQFVPFNLDNVIEGWKQGIPLFRKGGKGMLLIPSTLGYGNRQVGPIPPNSVLLFEIELVDFQN